MINEVGTDHGQTYIGEAHVRVGNDGAEFSVANTNVKSGIVDSGIFPLSPKTSGMYLSVRRDGANPYFGNLARLILN